jgi:hypothetical protein
MIRNEESAHKPKLDTPTRDFGPKVHNPDAPKYLRVGGYIGWVRVNRVEMAKTGRLLSKKRTLVRILCLQRVGTRKTDPYFLLKSLVLR